MDKEVRNIIESYYSGNCEDDNHKNCFRDDGIFDISRTGLPLYDKMLKKGNEYLKKYTKMEYELKCISSDEYIKKCALLYNTSFEKEINMISKTKLYDLKKAVDNGQRLYLPVIDFASKYQKGKYRVLVAEEKLFKKVPVMIVKKIKIYRDYSRKNL